MGRVIEDSNLIKHLPNMPKGRILLDDTTKLRWGRQFTNIEDKHLISLLLGNSFPIPSHYPESHHLE